MPYLLSLYTSIHYFSKILTYFTNALLSLPYECLVAKLEISVLCPGWNIKHCLDQEKEVSSLNDYGCSAKLNISMNINDLRSTDATSNTCYWFSLHYIP
jgi:hypothetical protein